MKSLQPQAAGFFFGSCAWLVLAHRVTILHLMSKAFTRETDPEDDDLPSAPPLAPDGKNYITRGGYERLRAELMNLIDNERPRIVDIVHWAASNGYSSYDDAKYALIAGQTNEQVQGSYSSFNEGLIALAGSAPVSGDGLLLESGDALLLESGDLLLLEA